MRLCFRAQSSHPKLLKDVFFPFVSIVFQPLLGAVCYSEAERKEEAEKRLEKRLEKRESLSLVLFFYILYVVTHASCTLSHALLQPRHAVIVKLRHTHWRLYICQARIRHKGVFNLTSCAHIDGTVATPSSILVTIRVTVMICGVCRSLLSFHFRSTFNRQDLEIHRSTTCVLVCRMARNQKYWAEPGKGWTKWEVAPSRI